jgi:hypothetical protein
MLCVLTTLLWLEVAACCARVCVCVCVSHCCCVCVCVCVCVCGRYKIVLAGDRIINTAVNLTPTPTDHINLVTTSQCLCR